MSIADEYNKKKLEILSREHTSPTDYTYLWNICVNYNDGDMISFGEPDLVSIMLCLDKLKGKPSSLLFAQSWSESIFLNKDFIPFVKKFEEKILLPASDLTGDIKRKEHITIIFMNAASISTNIMMYALTKAEDKDFKDEFYDDKNIYRSFQYNIIEFLQGINKGNSKQKFQCLVAIDKLMDEYFEVKEAISRLVGLNEPSSFMDIVVKTLKDCPSEQTHHIEDVVKVVYTYAISNELKQELIDNPQTNKKFKV